MLAWINSKIYRRYGEAISSVAISTGEWSFIWTAPTNAEISAQRRSWGILQKGIYCRRKGSIQHTFGSIFQFHDSRNEKWTIRSNWIGMTMDDSRFDRSAALTCDGRFDRSANIGGGVGNVRQWMNRRLVVKLRVAIIDLRDSWRKCGAATLLRAPR